jgi:transposase
MSRTAVKILLATPERELLEKIFRKRSVPEFMKQRLQVVLAASTVSQNQEIAAQYGLKIHFIGRWRNRWAKQYQTWQQTDETLRPEMNERLVLLWLSDEKGRGRKETITTEQRTKIAALSQESPDQNGFPVTHWSRDRLVQAAIGRGIVDAISASTIGRILKKRLVAPSQPLLAQCQN